MADSGRYQSRLFNFVKTRSRRLTEQYNRTIRHLQLSVKWGVQVLLAPYLLYQPRQSAQKLDQAVQQSRSQVQDSSVTELSRQLNPEEQIPTPDTPIQRILLLVDKPPLLHPTLIGNEPLAEPCTEEALLNLISKSEPVNFLAFLATWRFKLFPKFSPTQTLPNPHRPTIRGIATQLSNRTLVLVTDQNKILDSLTTQQQQKLQERIIEEVADYWRHQQLAYSNERTLRKTDSPLEHSLNNYQALAFLDRTVAELESNYLSPVSAVAIAFTQHSWGLVRRVQSQLSMLLSSKIQLGSKLPTANATDAHTLQIQALIWAAIDYFFGRHGEERATILSTSTSSELPSAQIPTSDPWLSESDLYGDPQQGSEFSTIHQPSTSNSAQPKQNPGSTSIQNLLNSFQKLFPQLNQTSRLVKHEKLTKAALGEELETESEESSPLERGEGEPRLKSSVRVSAGEINHTQSTQINPAPDWIETNATVMGYVKHPLEQLLQWLDRVMLWLEDVLIAVWRWVQLALHAGQK